MCQYVCVLCVGGVIFVWQSNNACWHINILTCLHRYSFWSFICCRTTALVLSWRHHPSPWHWFWWRHLLTSNGHHFCRRYEEVYDIDIVILMTMILIIYIFALALALSLFLSPSLLLSLSLSPSLAHHSCHIFSYDLAKIFVQNVTFRETKVILSVLNLGICYPVLLIREM